MRAIEGILYPVIFQKRFSESGFKNFLIDKASGGENQHSGVF
jgi:hypothetical protein